MRKPAERQTIIQYELALNLSSATSLEQALPLCLHAALQAGEMDAGGIYLPKRRTGDLQLMCAQGLSAEFVQAVTLIAADSDRARLVRQGVPIYTHYDQANLVELPVQHQEGLRGLAIIPIFHQGRLVACFNLASHTLADVPLHNRSAINTIAAHGQRHRPLAGRRRPARK